MEGSDAAAVARAKAADREAFRALVERHSRNVFRLAFRMTGNEEDAEDLVQETFLKAYRNLPRFAGQSEFSTWLHRIAANRAVDSLRRRVAPDAGTATRSERARSRRNRSDARARALRIGDPPADRPFARGPLGDGEGGLRAAPFEGRTIAEIGKTLGVRSGAAKNCVFRAVAKLRRDLGSFAGVAQ